MTRKNEYFEWIGVYKCIDIEKHDWKDGGQEYNGASRELSQSEPDIPLINNAADNPTSLVSIFSFYKPMKFLALRPSHGVIVITFLG